MGSSLLWQDECLPRLACCPKELPTLLKQERVRSRHHLAWQIQFRLVQGLQSKLQRWPIVLDQHVRPYLNHVVGPHSDNMRVERAMVDRAHSYSVRHNRFASVRVLFDVRCI